MAQHATHLKNLSALRFFAALGVMIFHIEHKKGLFDFPSALDRVPAISLVGYNSVTFFFVLSGYLITFLLLREKMVSYTIDVPKFYTRRALRIAPVYFVTILVGFFVLPLSPLFYIPGQTEALLEHRLPASLLSFAFLSNVAFSIYQNMASVDQTWSVSVEEQFYLFWPLVMLAVKPTHLPRVLVSIIVVGIAIRIILQPVPVLGTLAYLNWFGCMAIGAFAAIAAHDPNSRLFRILSSSAVFWAALVLTIAFLLLNLMPRAIRLAEPEINSVLFCVILLGVSTRQAAAVNLDSHKWRLLGNLSYSMYMYHNAFIALFCNLAVAGGVHGMASNAIIYPGAIGGTLLASWLSYMTFERRFLQMKERYAIIPSTA